MGKGGLPAEDWRSVRGGLLSEREKYGAENEEKRYRVVPLYLLAEKNRRECNKYHQRYHFLDDLQLKWAVRIRSYPICRNLKAIFEKRDAPAYQDDRAATAHAIGSPLSGKPGRWGMKIIG
jgi:hypothetical protein